MKLKEFNDRIQDERYGWHTVKVFTVAPHFSDAASLPRPICRTEEPVSVSEGLSIAQAYEDRGYAVEVRRMS